MKLFVVCSRNSRTSDDWPTDFLLLLIQSGAASSAFSIRLLEPHRHHSRSAGEVDGEGELSPRTPLTVHCCNDTITTVVTASFEKAPSVDQPFLPTLYRRRLRHTTLFILHPTAEPGKHLIRAARTPPERSKPTSTCVELLRGTA